MKKKEEKSRKKAQEGNKNGGLIVVIPYVNGQSEKVFRILGKKVTTATKLHTTLGRLLISPKYQVESTDGVYTIDCGGYERANVGKTNSKSRTILREHRKEVDKIMKGRSFTSKLKRFGDYRHVNHEKRVHFNMLFKYHCCFSVLSEIHSANLDAKVHMMWGKYRMIVLNRKLKVRFI